MLPHQHQSVILPPPEGYVLRHYKTLLTACGMVVAFCWAQSMSHLLVSRASLEQTLPEHPLGHPGAPSTLTASEARLWFTVFDLQGERHMMSAWSAVSSRLSLMRDLWPLRGVLVGHDVMGEDACADEPELFSGASVTNYDYTALGQASKVSSLR